MIAVVFKSKSYFNIVSFKIRGILNSVLRVADSSIIETDSRIHL